MKAIGGKLSVILLAIITVVAFTPLMSGPAYAGGGTDIGSLLSNQISGETVSVGKSLSVSMSDINDIYGTDYEGYEFVDYYAMGKTDAGFAIEKYDSSSKKVGTYSSLTFKYTVQSEDKGKYLRFETSGDESTYNNMTDRYYVPYDLSDGSSVNIASVKNLVLRINIPSDSTKVTFTNPNSSSTTRTIKIYSNMKCYEDSIEKTVSASSGAAGTATLNKGYHYIVFTTGTDTCAIKWSESSSESSSDPKLGMSKDSNGIMTVTGSVTGTTFKKVSILDKPNNTAKEIDYYLSGIAGKTSFSIKIDTKQYDIGFHQIKIVLNNGHSYTNVFKTEIYDKPTIKKNENFFSSGSNYICYRPYFTVNPDCDGIYMQMYDTKAKKWGDVYGPFPSYQILRTKYFIGNPKTGGTKVKANRTYKVRTFYGKMAKYEGKSYAIVGPFSKTVSVKTGKAKKPAVKSIKITKAKHKKIKLIGHAHWDAAGKWHPYTESYTWTTTYKVTVKLKKKPGTKGIYIGSKKVKGNKKTYSATFTDSGKLKGKKIKVEVCSYNDTVGGYSPVYSKKVKVK